MGKWATGVLSWHNPPYIRYTPDEVGNFGVPIGKISVEDLVDIMTAIEVLIQSSGRTGLALVSPYT